VTPDGLVLREFAPGLDAKTVQSHTDAPLTVPSNCKEMDVPANFHAAQPTR
jgi:acyl CoA:acetate/3-ketoacid CoA transferase beta subunit